MGLRAQKGINIYHWLTGGEYPVQIGVPLYELYSASLTVAPNITTLHLHMDVDFVMRSGGTTSIDFSLPLHRGRTVNINQTQTVNGQPITLDHVSTSATQSIIYLRAPQLNNGIDAYEVSVGNWSSRNSKTEVVVSHPWSENNDRLQPVEGVELEINYPLLNKAGDWTLLIQHEAIPGATSDVTFHFKV